MTGGAVTGGAVTGGGVTGGGVTGGSVTGATPAESRFTVSALRIAAGDGAAEERLAGLLDRMAATAGAEGVAVLVERRGRRVVVCRGGDPGAQSGLGAWLDASLPRKGSHGAEPATILAIGPAPNEPGDLGAIPADGRDAADGRVVPGSGDRRADRDPVPLRRMIEPAGRPRAAMAFDFGSERSARAVARRFTPPMARAAADIIGPMARLAEAERELAELRHADAERRRFVSVVAHELRTPLASLTGYLDLLAPDGRGEFLDRSRDLVAGMATIVADLLELSRLEAGQLHFVAAPFSGAEAAQAAVHDVRPLAAERDIALDVTLPSRLRMIHADRRRVQQVLVNLLGNAIKFSPDGTRIAISLRFDGPVALYTVRDQGPGVPPEELELIFEPFHRASGTERVVGTGLGLPIARDLTRRMGGELDVASAPGAGSAFVVALPATQVVEGAAVVGSLRLAL